MPKKPRPETKTFRCDCCGKKKRVKASELCPADWAIGSISPPDGGKRIRTIYCEKKSCQRQHQVRARKILGFTRIGI